MRKGGGVVSKDISEMIKIWTKRGGKMRGEEEESGKRRNKGEETK